MREAMRQPQRGTQKKTLDDQNVKKTEQNIDALLTIFSLMKTVTLTLHGAKVAYKYKLWINTGRKVWQMI